MSRAAAANRHSTRELGRFTSQATLRANQRALLAPVARWRKEPVKLGNSNIRVTKWVKYIDEGQEGDEADQVTEEQLTASVSGAESFLQPAVNPGIATAAPSVPTSSANTPASTTPLLAQPQLLSATAAPSGLSQSMTIQEPDMQGTQISATSETGLDAQAETQEVPAAMTDSEAAQLPVSATALATTEAIQGLSQQPAPDSGFASTVPEARLGATSEEQLNPPVDEPGVNTVLEAADDGSQMQLEAELREVDTLLAPELVGQEAESTRAALGVGDPVGGGPPEIVES